MTNWYIRFNRARLKGENGEKDAVAALNTLYETLMTVCLILVSLQGICKYCSMSLTQGFCTGPLHALHGRERLSRLAPLHPCSP